MGTGGSVPVQDGYVRTRFARSAKVTGVWCQPRSLTTSWRTGAIKPCFGTAPTGSRFARLATTRTLKSGTTNRCDKFGVAESSRKIPTSREVPTFREGPKIPPHPKNSATPQKFRYTPKIPLQVYTVYTGIQRYTPVYTDIYRYIPEYTDIHRHTPAYTGVYRGTPGYTGVYRPGAWTRTHGPGPSTDPARTHGPRAMATDPRTQHGPTDPARTHGPSTDPARPRHGPSTHARPRHGPSTDPRTQHGPSTHARTQHGPSTDPDPARGPGLGVNR
jgi:hypothetical protein